jgi:hypothetical protein
MCDVGMELYASLLHRLLTPLNSSPNAGGTVGRVFHFTPERSHNNVWVSGEGSPWNTQL